VGGGGGEEREVEKERRREESVRRHKRIKDVWPNAETLLAVSSLSRFSRLTSFFPRGLASGRYY
jgi:hypothetical protein